MHTLHLDIRCAWSDTIPVAERCGVLFQQTTLLDDLTVAGNLTVALSQAPPPSSSPSPSLPQQQQQQQQQQIQALLECVGLEYTRDGNKYPPELSGGMSRRVCLALQLAQQKRVIVLDEPFTGLDTHAGRSIAHELARVRRVHNTAFVLISHAPQLTDIVMTAAAATDEEDTTATPKDWNKHNRVIDLLAPTVVAVAAAAASSTGTTSSRRPTKLNLFGTTCCDRFLERLVDYTVYSVPLIGMAFLACGFAISMLSADLLIRLDVSGKVLELINTEVKPLIKVLTGSEATTLQMIGIRFKVNTMLQQTLPPAKARLYAIGITKLFVLEIGPLVTALLLCGRIGGSYAGKVATMQATNQNKLLGVLGISPYQWTYYPAIVAATIAAPILTIMGTSIAIYVGGYIATQYNITHPDTNYWTDVTKSIVPPLRLHSFEPCWTKMNADGTEDVNNYNDLVTILFSIVSIMSEAMMSKLTGGNSPSLDVRVTYKATTDSSSPYGWIADTLIEIVTYPLIYHLLKSEIFIVTIMSVAEYVARKNINLTPKGVPACITQSVVISGLLVICLDWAFSQLWLLRE